MENAEQRNLFVRKEIERGNLKRALAVIKENTALKFRQETNKK